MMIPSLLVAATLSVALAQPKPYTHQNFLDDPEEFTFAVLPDRTGGDFRGAWTNALSKVNLLRPTFVITVGDLIPAGWLDEPRVVAQQEELAGMLKGVVPPFYAVVGNHDIQSPVSKRVWQRFFGPDTYYSFIYKNVLFMALNTQDEGISDAQYAWAKAQLKEHADVRWTFFFMHSPSTWKSARWEDFEKTALAGRKCTVFAGDLHTYFHARRNGHDYYALSVAGGGSSSNGQNPKYAATLKGPAYGEMDHLAWVSMTKDKPVIANILLDGILPADYLDQSNSKTTYVTSVYDEPADPKVVAHLKELDAVSKSRIYRWDAKTFDRWTAPDGGRPVAAWTIADRVLTGDASNGPVSIELAQDYGDADLHFQYRLPKGSVARLSYLDRTSPSEAIDYEISEAVCAPDTWTHGRLAVTEDLVTYEVDGVKSKAFTRQTMKPKGRYRLTVLKGKVDFRGFYVFDLR